MNLQEGITRKEWERYEKSIELFEKSPVWYYAKLVWLLLQSCLMLAVVLLLILFLVRFRVWNILVISVIVSVLSYVAAMLNRPWKGLLKLDRRKYRSLYRKINWISRKAHGPKVHAIYISYDFNAAAASAFTCIPFAKRNVLILGYPLLAAVSQKALIGILAHELGHMAKNHLSVSLIFYSVTTFWESLRPGVFNIVTGLWLKRYLPALHIAALPIYRRHEKEADKFIADTFGADYAASSLIQNELAAYRYSKLDLRDELISENWKNFDIAMFYRNYFAEKISPEEAEMVIGKALRRASPVNEEHPPLRERLAVAGILDWHSCSLAATDALSKLTGDSPEFYSEVNKFLHSLYDLGVEDAKKELEDASDYLRKNPPNPDADIVTVSEVINSLNTAGRPQERDEFIELCYSRHPEIPEIACHYAMLLVEKGDEKNGISLIEKSVSRCPSLILTAAADILQNYYLDTGDTDKIKKFLDMRSGQTGKVSGKIAAPLDRNDELYGFTPDPSDAERLTVRLSGISLVGRAFCVRRPVEKGSSVSVIFVIIEPAGGMFFKYSRSIDDILTELSAEFGFRFEKKRRSYCRENLEHIPGALFFERQIR